MEIVDGRITQYFDTPTTYIAGRNYHEAIDYVTNGPKEIHAPFDGVIVRAIDSHSESTITGYGNRIYLQSEDGTVTDSFAHLQQYSGLSTGDHVEKGQVIALTGRTGYRFPRSIWHTHHERVINNTRVDPLDDSTLPTNSLTEEEMKELEQMLLDIQNHLQVIEDKVTVLEGYHLNNSGEERLKNIGRNVKDIHEATVK